MVATRNKDAVENSCAAVCGLVRSFHWHCGSVRCMAESGVGASGFVWYLLEIVADRRIWARFFHPSVAGAVLVYS